MNLLKQLWRDEFGLVLSAEAVCIGTVGVLGAITGLSMMATAVNEEMQDMSFALRSLDQSYVVSSRRTLGAQTARSCYVQNDVNESLAELQLLSNRLEKAASEAQQKRKAEQKIQEKNELNERNENSEFEKSSNAIYYPEA